MIFLWQDYLLNEGFDLSQDKLGLEQFKILDITIIVELFLLGIKVKGASLLGFYFVFVVNSLYKVY